MYKNPLLDDEFLKELYRNRDKTIFAKIIALTLSNEPIEEIQGQVTGGSVNIDGTSNVRRSCSLSLVAKDLNINQYYWGLKTRFKLYIGLNNTVGWDYEDIIWFPMGTYVISNFTTSQSVNNYTISITGKDKMCLLNGDLSGSLFASVDFGKEEYYDKVTKITTIKYIPIKDIIREAVHAYADETWENIVINDLEDFGIELLDYKGVYPMYIYFNDTTVDSTKEAYNYTTLGEQRVYPINKTASGELIHDDQGRYEIMSGYEPHIDPQTHQEVPGGVRIDEIGVEGTPGQNFVYEDRVELDLGDIERANATRFIIDIKTDEGRKEAYTIAKIKTGDTCGYRLTDITYPGDLILGVGEPLTALFDKLVAMLGNFEYFYDLDGRFVFQRKKTFIDKTWTNIKTTGETWYASSKDETYVESAAYSTPTTWTFGDSFLITSYANSPVLNNVKNDFSIWGTKRSVTGSELPVHVRYAVDKKPTYYKTFDGVEWTTEIGHWWVLEGVGEVNETFETLRNKLKVTLKDELKKDLKKDSINFSFQHLEEINNMGLESPILDPVSGIWSGGWWNIKDWYNYYFLLNHRYPKKTMKWYAHSGELGCQQSNITYNALTAHGFTAPRGDPNRYIWQLEVRPNGVINYGHSSGQRGGNGTVQSGWISFKFEDDDFHKQTLEEQEFELIKPLLDTDIEGNFIVRTDPYDSNIKIYKLKEQRYIAQPHVGCSEWHTFDTFLSETQYKNSEYYFYNPSFENQEAGKEDDLEAYLEARVEDMLKVKENVINYLAEEGYREVIHEASSLCDWREIIFQMALDYRKHNHDDDFYIKLRDNNGRDLNDQWYYPNGRTGYEQYYVDMEGFWRQLYCPPQLMETLFPSGVWTERESYGRIEYDTGEILPDNENGLYFSKSTGIVYSLYSYDGYREGETREQWINSWVEHQTPNDGWNVEVLDSPQTLNFWFDFLEADENSNLVKYSVPAIGDRAKSVNDDKVKAIYFRETPTVLFTENIQSVDRKTGYTYVQYKPEMANLFNISSQGKSAVDVMEEFINLYLYCVESISISSIPVYQLQPNTRIMVYDEHSKINGEYLLNRITIPLTFNGTMSVSATKSAETIY